MLRSGASVLVYQCSLDELAQIRFAVHQLLQQGHKGFQYRKRRPAQRGVPGFTLDKYLHLVGVLREVPAETFHDVAGYGQLTEVIHSSAQFIKCIRTVIFSSMYKLQHAMLGSFQLPLIATEGGQRVTFHQIKQSRGNLPHSGGKIMVKGSHLVIYTAVRGCQTLLHGLIFREVYAPESFQQRAAPFQIGGGIQVQDAEHQGTQRKCVLGRVVALDIFCAAFVEKVRLVVQNLSPSCVGAIVGGKRLCVFRCFRNSREKCVNHPT